MPSTANIADLIKKVLFYAKFEIPLLNPTDDAFVSSQPNPSRSQDVRPSFKDKFLADITTVPAILQSSHLSGLDGLRGISIIIVILAHVTRDTSLNRYFDGVIGVQVFFVISGFLITTLLLKEKVKTGTISLKHFYIRRVLRIVPVAYLFLLVLSILNYCFNLGVTFKSFLIALFYLKNLKIPGGDWYTGHFWTLSVEEQFYLLFPFLLKFNLNKFTITCIVLIILFPVFYFIDKERVSFFYSNDFTSALVSGFLLLFGQGTVCILVGSLFSVLLFKKIINADHFRNGFLTSFLLFILAYILNTRTLPVFKPSTTPIVFSVIIGIIIIQNLAQQKNFFAILLNNRFLVKIGVLSYSLYIWQQLFTDNQPWQHAFKYSDSIILNLVLLYVVSYISYYFYEKKFLILKNRFK